ncbi:MATE family efflux transporter [Sphingomonas sp.]|uniref:MATE family efflux transporter n=1 Tax=Sphingomonas sp. TaxID=28214 RepID=UPI002DB76F4C|nr:MATE family efflux transporter [Sphingomonas sp.]HEU4969765.1 MATE family efflux transporter [Sphingomonas sp.]
MARENPANRRDLTQGPIGSTLLLFALPTLGSSVLQSLNGSINAIWIGQILGEKALAATTNASLVMFLLFAAVFGFGMAATILVGQHMGRRDVDAARRALGTALGLFIALAAVTVTAGWIFAPDLLRLLSTPPDVFPLALAYLRVIFLFMPASYLTVLLMMGLRGTGDSMTPLYFMGLSAVLDVALNPVFILGLGPAPALGIQGSAVAAVIAGLIGVTGMVVFIYAKDLPIRLRGREWRYLVCDRALLKRIVGLGIPMGLQMIVVSTSALAMIGLVNQQGTETTAAYGAANQLWTYIQMPAMAIGAAVSAMVAQNIGADRWDRVAQITRAGVWMNILMTGVLLGVLILLDRHVLWLFLGDDADGIAIATRIHLLASWSFLLFGVSIVLSATVRANGAVIGPLVILAIAMFPVRFGFAYALEPSWGGDAIWWSFPLGSAASMLLTIGYYLHGGWRKQRLVGPPSAAEAEERTLADADATAKMNPVG